MLKCCGIRSNSCRDAITVARKLCCEMRLQSIHTSKGFNLWKTPTMGTCPSPTFDSILRRREMHATAKAHPHITISGSKEIAYGFESLAIAIFFMCIVSPSFYLLGFVDDDHVSCWTTAYLQLSRTHCQHIFHSEIESKTRIQWNVKSIWNTQRHWKGNEKKLFWCIHINGIAIALRHSVADGSTKSTTNRNRWKYFLQKSNVDVLRIFFGSNDLPVCLFQGKRGHRTEGVDECTTIWIRECGMVASTVLDWTLDVLNRILVVIDWPAPRWPVVAVVAFDL